MSYEPIQTRVTDRPKYSEPETVIHQAELTGQEARYALAMIERWGMIMGAADGEDSAGRMKLRIMTPDELVERAFAVTEAAFAKARELGWMIDTPLPLVVVPVADDGEKEKVA